MVVPIEKVSRSSNKFVGNNLNVNVANNKITLAVTGNNCKIKIEENSGLIRVVGDRCDVTVLKGSANIDYVGNRGRIHLGRDVSDNTVTYVGNQGEISTVGTDPDANSGSCRETPKPTRVASDSSETLNISNSTRIRMANPGFPNNINVPFPVIRIVPTDNDLRKDLEVCLETCIYLQYSCQMFSCQCQYYGQKRRYRYCG